jgi:hypothetical protein
MSLTYVNGCVVAQASSTPDDRPDCHWMLASEANFFRFMPDH